MGCKDCDNNNTTYSRCNPLISSNCVSYQGEGKVCENDSTFSICKGDNFSIVQSMIFDKICTISGQIDISTIEIPNCLKNAWNNNDLTILNLFVLLLENSCSTQEQLTNLTNNLNTVNPVVNICLSCCSDEGSCNGNISVQLSVALQKIIDCLCAAKAEISTLNSNVATLQSAYNGLQDQLTTIINFNTQQVALNIQLQQDIAGIKCGLDSEGIPYTC